MDPEIKETVRRLGPGRYLHRVIPILDASGKVVDRIVKPLMVEMRARDVVQVVVGASILAIPAGFTEETWNLGHELPTANVAVIAAISVAFIAFFTYFNFYREYISEYRWQFVTRIFAIYGLSLLVEQAMGLSPFDGDLFVEFSCQTVKVLLEFIEQRSRGYYSNDTYRLIDKILHASA